MPLSLSEALARAQTFPARFQAFSRILDAIRSGIDFVLRVSSVLLAVFLIHQMLFWATKDPERSFNVAALILDVTEIVWDFSGILYNALADILNAAVIPLWNGATYYIIEPTVSLVLEVFSLIFLRKQYTGFIKSSDLPYGGFVCDSTSVASSTWCGRFNAYNARLEGGDSLTKDGSITFGTATARRLSELSGEADFDTPSFESGELVGILDGLATQAIVMGSSVFDVLFAVGYDVLSTSAVFLFDAAYTILKILFDMLKLIVKSGMLQTLLSIGIDFILIMVLEVYVPYLMAMIDAVVCVFQMFSWQSWNEQLKCGAGHVQRHLSNTPTFPHPPPHIPFRLCPLARSREEVLPGPRRRRRPLDVHLHPAGRRALRLHPRGDPQLENRSQVYRRRGVRPRRLQARERLPLAQRQRVHQLLRVQVPRTEVRTFSPYPAQSLSAERGPPFPILVTTTHNSRVSYAQGRLVRHRHLRLAAQTRKLQHLLRQRDRALHE